MKSLKEKQCEDCRYFFVRVTDKKTGVCKYNPPAYIQISQHNLQSYWPSVWKDDVCGKHKKDKTKK